MGVRRWGISALIAGLALVCAPSASADPVTYEHMLTVSVLDGGSVVSDPAGIDCPGVCSVTEEYTTDCPGEACVEEWDVEWGSYTLTAGGKGDGWKPHWTGCYDADDGDAICTVALDTERFVELDWWDVGLPQITSSSIPERARNVIEMRADVTDNGAVQDVRFYVSAKLVNTDFEAPYAATFDASALSHGALPRVKIVARDRSANEESLSSRVKIDHAAGVTAHVPEYFGARSISIRADSDVVSTVCAVGDAAATPCGRGWAPAFAADGPQTLHITATDDLGNVGTFTASTIVDRTAPVLAITTGPAHESADNPADVTFAFTQTEVNPGVTSCAIDLWTPVPCTASQSFTISGLTDGVHVLAIGVTDRAGNATRIERRFRVGPEPVIASSLPLTLKVVVRGIVLKHATRLNQLLVRRVPQGARLTVQCFGASCPVTRVIVKGAGRAVSLPDFLHETLRPGLRLRLTLRRRGEAPVRKTVTIRRGRGPLVR